MKPSIDVNERSPGDANEPGHEEKKGVDGKPWTGWGKSFGTRVQSSRKLILLKCSNSHGPRLQMSNVTRHCCRGHHFHPACDITYLSSPHYLAVADSGLVEQLGATGHWGHTYRGSGQLAAHPHPLGNHENRKNLGCLVDFW
jgi:hypothetical protein